jgi:hypothetical protein
MVLTPTKRATSAKVLLPVPRRFFSVMRSPALLATFLPGRSLKPNLLTRHVKNHSFGRASPRDLFRMIEHVRCLQPRQTHSKEMLAITRFLTITVLALTFATIITENR